MQIVDEKIKEFLRSVSNIYKENEKEIQIFCPFCDDAFRKENPKWGHLYISKEKGLFFCHRCNEKGTLVKLLNEYEFDDKEKIKELSFYFNKNSLFSKLEKEDVIINFSNPSSLDSNFLSALYISYFDKKNNQSRSYLQKRLGISTIDEFLFYKILLEKDGVVFCDENFRPIIKRFIRGRKRYKKIVSNKYYFIKNDFSNIALITEGVFDAINLHKVFYFNANIFAILGKNYVQATINLLKYNFKKIIIAVHNDIDTKKLSFFLKRKILKFKDKLPLPEINVISNGLGKDFNENFVKII